MPCLQSGVQPPRCKTQARGKTVHVQTLCETYTDFLPLPLQWKKHRIPDAKPNKRHKE
jgi:hypothetical protein